MIKLSFISPTKYIRTLGAQSDFTLALSHLIDRHESNEYERAILDIGLPIVLDNGLFENHSPEGIDSVLDKALRIKATHFFAPDYLYDAEKTLRGVENAIYIIKQRGVVNQIKIAAVVQGETEEEYLSQYDKFQEIEEIDLIGLSILSIPRCFGEQKTTRKESYKHKDNEITSSRIKLLKILLERGRNNKKVHLLGLGNSYEEVIFANKNCSFVISQDTSSPIWNGFQGKKILDDGSIEGGKTDVKVDFNYNQASKEQIKLAQYNINKIKSLIK